MSLEKAIKMAIKSMKNYHLNKKYYNEIMRLLCFFQKRNSAFLFQNEFEFSFVEKNNSLRFLHLLFWNQDLDNKTFIKIIREREENIKKIFKIINNDFNCKYNNILIKKFFKFNKKNGFWPVQFGLEYDKKSKPKLKIYLSVNGNPFPLKKFCGMFDLNYQVLNKQFKGAKFDTIAIDFLPDGDYCFKFYPLIGKNKGLLCRIDKDLKIISIKKWIRFPDGLLVTDKRIVDFIKLPTDLQEIIKNNNFKIHYICEENGKKSVYYR